VGSELKFLLQFASLSIALFAAFVNFSRVHSGRGVCGFDWFFQAVATTAFVALTWF